jgi:predicted AAA+ superfamily ATPase
MITRSRHTAAIRRLLDQFPIVGILGARQVGKTTIARQIGETYPGPVTRFDLRDLDDLAKLTDPGLALGALRGLVVLDEIQRRPDLLPVLRLLADRKDDPSRFLVLGSASSEIADHHLGGFALDEVGFEEADALWLRGGFPCSFLADDDAASQEWRREFVRTVLERDLPRLGVRIPGTTLGRFWQMLAHYHGQVWNGAELSRAFGVSQSAVRRYLDALADALVLWTLPPWQENLGRRQVRSPKIYIRDTGLLHSLLGLTTQDALFGHPKVGASWEGFVLQEAIRVLGACEDECYFWETYSGAALDLLVVRGNQCVGIEVKRTTAPRTTRSLHAAREALGLEEVVMIHAGDVSFPIAEGVRAVAFARLAEDLAPL